MAAFVFLPNLYSRKEDPNGHGQTVLKASADPPHPRGRTDRATAGPLQARVTTPVRQRTVFSAVSSTFSGYLGGRGGAEFGRFCCRIISGWRFQKGVWATEAKNSPCVHPRAERHCMREGCAGETEGKWNSKLRKMGRRSKFALFFYIRSVHVRAPYSWRLGLHADG